MVDFADMICRLSGSRIIVGVDEVGRGAIAGPLVVGAVQLSSLIDGITDSKTIKPSQRAKLSNIIRTKAEQTSFGIASAKEIDRLGMAKALILAYQRALKPLKFDLVLTDALSLPGIPFVKSIKGDSIFYAVSAASIIAKVYRDQLMTVYDIFYPYYNWRQNVGYGTTEHLALINKYGRSSLHRNSFLDKK